MVCLHSNIRDARWRILSSLFDLLEDRIPVRVTLLFLHFYIFRSVFGDGM
jgi:hypothetical protein